MDLSNLKEAVLRLFEKDDAARDLFDLSEELGADAGEMQTVLNELCAEGRLAVTKKGKYAPAEALGLVRASAWALRSGAPMARLESGESLRVRALGRLRCLPGDELLVRPVDQEECELAAILRRGKTELPAFLRVRSRSEARRSAHRRSEDGARITAAACDRRIPYAIVVHSDVPAPNNAIALLAIDRYPEGDEPMQAHVLRLLGDRSDMRARLRSIAEGHGFATEYPERAKQTFAPVSEADFAGRDDLREMLTMTIDGPFSKDFDDAVSLERAENGDWRLGVHIADVSHYVRPGSPVDAEALARGTSLYLPGLTVPMLPEILSDELCSLVPGEDRLTMSLFMTLRSGRIVDHRLCRAVIRSHARLTYDAVNRFLDGDSAAVPEEVQPALSDMLRASHTLRARRMEAGCLELDLPETEFTLDEEGVPTDVYCAPRGEAERMIEDFMLAANETVAMLARTTETPLVYRVHEEPDAERIRDLKKELTLLGIPARFGLHPKPGELQAVLTAAKGHPAEDTVRRMTLRALQRARYADRPLGHYALAMPDYCHFTSPIRRYPDLTVHRMLKMLLDGRDTSNASNQMAAVANQSTARENESTLAEREGDALMKARYMADRIGRRYEGRITGVTGWGLFVSLTNTVEGFVPIASLDDYYEFDAERRRLIASGTGRFFQMGDRVCIRVEAVNLDLAEVEFKLLPWRDRV